MTLLDSHTVPSTDILDFFVDEGSRFTTLSGIGLYPAPDSVEVVDEFEDQMDTDTSTAVARCSDGNGTLSFLFFSDDEFEIARAKAICSKCRLAADCLSGALERAEVYGVWGGELLIDGVIVKVKRGRGRPPKTPRPVLVVDEVPVPPHMVA